MIAGNVFISDVTHAYCSGNIAYTEQGLTEPMPIHIGDGTWIGQNVIVAPGVTIDKNVVIGANSFVNKSIPSQSIAVGSPAKVIKMWNDGAWTKV